FGDFLIELRNKRVDTGTGNITGEEVSEDEPHNEGGDCKHVRRHLVGLFAEYTLRSSTFCRKFAAFAVTEVRVRICFNAAALQAADGTDRLETSGLRASHRGVGCRISALAGTLGRRRCVTIPRSRFYEFGRTRGEAHGRRRESEADHRRAIA